MRIRLSWLILICTSVVIPAVLPLTAAARPDLRESVLVAFDGQNGNFVDGLSMDSAGNLWGVTAWGGTATDCSPAPGCGNVFRLTKSRSGWTLQIIYTFQGGSDGQYPTGGLVFDAAGNAYGETGSGGSSSCACGTIYEISLRSGHYEKTEIYSFSDTSTHNDGEGPFGGLVIDSAGNLYGTTINGGNRFTCNCGTVFELSPSRRLD